MSAASSLFDSELARENSVYSGLVEQEGHHHVVMEEAQSQLRLIPEGKIKPDASDPHPTTPQLHLVSQFHSLIDSRIFPCIGAKEVSLNGRYRIGVYGALASEAAVAGQGRDLRRFVCDQDQIAGRSSFIAIFDGPLPTTEDAFEQQLWKHLQMLHDNDVPEWDADYSCDPENWNWAFSFNKRAFLIVGFHPHATRAARQFSKVVLVFNAERQIAQLGAKLPLWTKDIRAHDLALQGYSDPMFPPADQEVSEAYLYAGMPLARAASATGRFLCPFKARADVDSAFDRSPAAKLGRPLEATAKATPESAAKPTPKSTPKPGGRPDGIAPEAPSVCPFKKETAHG